MVLRALALALALASAALLVGPSAASAFSVDLLVGDALALYGWKPSAARYVRSAVQITVEPAVHPYGLYYGGGRVTIATPDPPVAYTSRAVSHELGHAVEDLRGYSPATAGVLLYDLLRLGDEANYPAAAFAARHILGLRAGPSGNPELDGQFGGLLDRQDWGHLLLAIVEGGTGYDVALLPPWFRDAYYPHLDPAPPARVRVAFSNEPPPPDLSARRQRVVDLIARLCGPRLPGATVAPAGTCAGRSVRADLPFEPLPGAGGRGPAAPGAPPLPGARAAARPATPLPIATRSDATTATPPIGGPAAASAARSAPAEVNAPAPTSAAPESPGLLSLLQLRRML